MKCLLQETDVLNKRVIVRCDFNVPVKDGHILDDTKIKASLETINYLIDKNCKIILLSHFGKVKTEEDKKKQQNTTINNTIDEENIVDTNSSVISNVTNNVAVQSNTEM